MLEGLCYQAVTVKVWIFAMIPICEKSESQGAVPACKCAPHVPRHHSPSSSTAPTPAHSHAPVTFCFDVCLFHRRSGPRHIPGIRGGRVRYHEAETPKSVLR